MPRDIQQQGEEPGKALLTALGRAINETGIRLRKLKKADRPGLVIFVITTDGLENSSTEFTKAQIKEMIEHQRTKYGWHFTFLGANQDAFAEAGAMGMHRDAVANFAMEKVGAAYDMTSRKISRMRSQHRKGEAVLDEFTDEERKKMM